MILINVIEFGHQADDLLTISTTDFLSQKMITLLFLSLAAQSITATVKAKSSKYSILGSCWATNPFLKPYVQAPLKEQPKPNLSDLAASVEKTQFHLQQVWH